MAGLEVGRLSLMRRTIKNNRMTKPHNANHTKLEYRGRGCRTKLGFLRLIFLSPKINSVTLPSEIDSWRRDNTLEGLAEIMEPLGDFNAVKTMQCRSRTKWKDLHNEVGRLYSVKEHDLETERETEESERKKERASSEQKMDRFFFSFFFFS